MKKEVSEARFSIDLVLECVRGLSALWVFMFHIADTFKISSPFFYAIARYGYQGVAVFFVISGYCIYSAAEKTIRNQQHPNTFLMRRLIRVMPPFWASIIFLVILPFLLEAISSIKSGSYISPFVGWMRFTGIDWLELITLTRVFFSNNGDLQGAFSPINAVYWSLAIELQLYLVMYVAIFFKSNWKTFLVAVLGISIFSSFLTATTKSGLFLEFWPAFFFGIALRWVHQRGITPWLIFGKSEKLASGVGAGILITAVSLFIFSPMRVAMLLPTPVPNMDFIAASALSAVLLWMLGGIEHGALLSTNRPPKQVRSLGLILLPLCWLGQSSYSLYLLHGQLYRLPDMFIRQIISPHSILYPFLIIVATSILCFGFYKIVEVPFQKGARNFANGGASGESVIGPLNTKQV